MRFYLIICLLGVTTLLSAQKVKFYATTDASKIVEGSYLSVEFTLEQTEGTNFRPPNFKGFEVVSGPSTSNSTSIINGRVSKKISYSYGLQPKGIGKKTIGPASISVKGKTLKTQTVNIEVVKGSNKSASADKQVFIKAELTDTSAFVGQQIILNYKLYTVLDIRSINFNTELEFDGFYAEELRRSRQDVQREIIDGIEYYTKSLKTIALFPQQTGTYSIDPTSVTVGISKGGNTRRSFFFNSQLIQKRIMVDGISVYVNNLPPSSSNFSGAVGRYRMSVNKPKRSITTDEAIVVNMEITGNGDSKTVNAPKWNLPDGLEMYDPNVIEDEVFSSTKGITHRKTFEYLIVAKEPGKYSLKPTFEYFDVDSSAYRSLEKSLPRITVIQGSNNPNIIESKPDVELAGIFETTKLKKLAGSSSKSPLAWILLIFGLIGAIGIFLYTNHLKKSGKFDPDLIRKNKAYSVAIRRLEGSKSFMDNNQSKEFHEEIIRALKTYVTDKYDIPALHINRSELIDRLREANVTDTLLGSLQGLLKESEMAMYAPSADFDLKSSYNAAVELIAGLEK